jgi:hypothetical protein
MNYLPGGGSAMICKICGMKAGSGGVTQPEGDRLHVVVADDKPYLLLANDFICQICQEKVIWYKKEK